MDGFEWVVDGVDLFRNEGVGRLFLLTVSREVGWH